MNPPLSPNYKCNFFQRLSQKNQEKLQCNNKLEIKGIKVIVELKQFDILRTNNK